MLEIIKEFVPVIVALCSGSGILAVIYNNKAKKASDLDKSMSEISSSLKSMESNLSSIDVRVCNLHNEVSQTNEDIKAVRKELYDLAYQSTKVDRITCNAILTIIGGLEDKKIINGTGEKARQQITDGLSNLSQYQNKLMKEVIDNED